MLVPDPVPASGAVVVPPVVVPPPPVASAPWVLAELPVSGVSMSLGDLAKCSIKCSFCLYVPNKPSIN